MYSFPNFEPVCCPMSFSNYCSLTCIQVSQEAGEVVWYSHLCQNFPQFVVIHIVKGFSVVNEEEVDVFLELSWFFYNPLDVDNLISGSSVFYNSNLNIWKFLVHVLLRPSLENFEHYFADIAIQLLTNSFRTRPPCPWVQISKGKNPGLPWFVPGVSLL